MNIVRFSLAVILGLALISLTSGGVFADTNSFYSQVSSGGLTVNKTIKNPDTGAFVNNLGPSDAKLSPNSEAVFHVQVTNTSSSDFGTVSFTDMLPEFMTFSTGSANMSWNKDTRQLNWTIDNLKAGQSQEFEIKTLVAPRENLPADKSLDCVTNSVTAAVSGQSAQASSGVCIQNISILPPTGPNPWLMTMLLGMGITGVILVRKSSVN